MTTLTCEAPAKINLDLRIRRPDPSGYHPLSSHVQSVDWYDHLQFSVAGEDALEVAGLPVEAGPENLIWQALRTVHPERAAGLHIRLSKRIPAAAGLGGGSADAAATLLAARRLFGVEVSTELAAGIGADVPFFLTGGTALLEGYGEVISPRPFAGGYALVIVVPPFDLATPSVYRAWDRLDGPRGRPVEGTDLPPAVRSMAPLVNDLYPAAVSLRSELDDWRAEMATRWDRPVLMSGSGPALFAFFTDRNEADDASTAVPPGVRFAEPAVPVAHGARVVDG
jgi:4-diphosphocytidyl-2-C-methyl-D-erythritol kinase